MRDQAWPGSLTATETALRAKLPFTSLPLLWVGKARSQSSGEIQRGHQTQPEENSSCREGYVVRSGSPGVSKVWPAQPHPRGQGTAMAIFLAGLEGEAGTVRAQGREGAETWGTAGWSLGFSGRGRKMELAVSEHDMGGMDLSSKRKLREFPTGPVGWR